MLHTLPILFLFIKLPYILKRKYRTNNHEEKRIEKDRAHTIFNFHSTNQPLSSSSCSSSCACPSTIYHRSSPRIYIYIFFSFFLFSFPTISQPAVFHSYYRYISLYWLCQRCSPTDVLLSIETDRDAWVERGRSSFLDPNCPFLFFALISISTDPHLEEKSSHRAIGSPRFRKNGEGFSNRRTSVKSNFRGMQMALVEFLWR